MPTAEPLYVEVSPLLNRRFTGIARFAARLVEALARVVPLRLFCTLDRAEIRRRGLRPDLAAGQVLVVEPGSLVPADPDVEGWTRQLLRGSRRTCKPDVMRRCAALFTQLRPPTRCFRREIGILYDFTPLLLPWAHAHGTRQLFGEFFADSSRQFDQVIAISRATRADARWLSALKAETVFLGYPGPSLCVEEHAAPEPQRRSDRLILVVSTHEPRKNGAFLLDWFATTHTLPADMELAWVGPAGWLCDKPAPAGRRKVHFLGTVTDHSLCRLYRRATFAAYPSLYEGFGFPVLDALCHGTRVLCGFHSSLQEFAGPGVHYVDARDPASLDQACLDLLACQAVPFARPDLASRCSWDTLARTILDAIQQPETPLLQTGLAFADENPHCAVKPSLDAYGSWPAGVLCPIRELA